MGKQAAVGVFVDTRAAPVFSHEFYSFLDASRWIAALFVVISHVRHLILVDYSKAEQPSLLFKGIYFCSGLGHEAVVIFFVISGFLVGGSTLEKWKREGSKPLDYATARVARIYTVFAPALLVCAFLDMAGAKWLDGAQLYSQPARYHTISLFAPITEQLDLSTLLGNLAMLQTIAVPVSGSNGPLWSLAYEWWYYCVFFLAALIIVEPTMKRGIICITGIALLGWLLPVNWLLMGVLWLMGVVIYFISIGRSTRIHPLIGASIFLAALTWSRLSHNADNVDHPETIFISFGRDCLVAAGFSVFIRSMVRTQMKWRYARVHRALADFSYSTYLVHFPMLVFVVALANQEFDVDFLRQPGYRSLAYMIAVTVFLYAFSYAFSLISERHTNGTRDWLRSTWRRAVTAPVAK